MMIMFKNLQLQIFPHAARFIFLALLWLLFAGCMPLVRLPPAPRQILSAREANAQTSKKTPPANAKRKKTPAFSHRSAKATREIK
jgi:hypothetical protein